MKITILGSGSAYGCPTCFNQWGEADPDNGKNERTRASILLETQGKTFLIDAGPDFRQQINRNKVRNVDAVLLTHGHYDHIGGVPELPRASKILAHSLSVWASKETLEELQRCYFYLFNGGEKESTGIQWNLLPDFGKTEIAGVDFFMFTVPHHNLRCSAFRCGDMAYVTDWENIPEQALKYLQDLKLLVIECNNGTEESVNGHSNLALVKKYADIIKSQQVVLSHLSTRVDYEAFFSLLPQNWQPAYDGLAIEI